jgi:uncharacterized protein (TIGR01244 family)
MDRRLVWLAGSVATAAVAWLIFVLYTTEAPAVVSKEAQSGATGAQDSALVIPSPVEPLKPEIVFVGPRENIPEEAPTAYGFWSFAVPAPGALSRSGQPLIGEFEWLRTQGWRSVVNLRVDGEREEVGDDAKIPGFNELGLNYLHLPIIDGHPPTEEQAIEFLEFVTDPANQPAHVHCRGGIGRAGTMTALYRYAVQGWPMEKAIEESRAFQGGVSTLQEPWLLEWARSHEPGGYAN